MNCQIQKRITARLLAGVFASGLALWAQTAAAGPRDGRGQAGVIPPDGQYGGKTYGEWAAEWWQWALSVPTPSNPLLDPTGEFASVGQHGHVWFVAGTLGDSASRTFTVPAGKAIFMPIHCWIFGATVWDCDPSNPGVPCDVPTLRASAAAAVNGAQVLEATIDGRPLKNLTAYRAVSPGPFSITLPGENLTGLDAGTYAPHVTDGYWLMLAPLSAGTHNIWLHVINPAAGIEYEINYVITVTGGPEGN